MPSILDKKVGEIVSDNFRTAPVFKKHHIDFCCGGGITLEKACEKSHTDVNSLIAELETVAETSISHEVQQVSTYELDQLADYIERVHHKYVEHRSSEIIPFLEKVVRVHGEKEPSLYEVQKSFMECVSALAQHMKKEELILFPTIKNMVVSKRNQVKYEPRHISSLGAPINQMESEHEDEGDRLKKLYEVTNSFTPPEWACNTYKVLFALMHEFFEDLQVHIHLENNVLFPKALALEATLDK